jgi:small conductance mechanosensitive channel
MFLAGWHIKILKIAAIIFVSILCYKILKYILYKNENKNGERELDHRTRTFNRLVISILRALTVVISQLCILKVVGFNIQSLMAGLGLASVVVGLAVQDVLKDIIRGVSIIGDSYFQVGDIVRYKDMEGEVISLGLLSTKIRSLYTQNIHTISNRHFEEAEIVSSFYKEKIPMPYDLTVCQAEKIVRDIVRRIRKNEHVDSARYLGITDLGDSCIYYYVEVRSDPLYRRQVRRDTLRSILLGMEEAGISVPYPQMDIHNIDSSQRKEEIGKIVNTREFREFEEKNREASSDSLFRTEKYQALFTGENADEVLDGVEHFSWRMGCTQKENLQLRLLAEELLELVKNTTSRSRLEMTYTEKGRVCKIRTRIDSELDGALREKINALAEKGKESGAGSNGGIISKLTSIAAKLLSSDNRLEGRVWSMKEYINSVSDKEFPGPVEEREKALQEIETSIIANLADEITVRFNQDEVIIEAEKRL